MANELGDVRRSQVVTTHGPGSIVDFRAGGYGGAGISVVAAGLETWDREAPPEGLGHPQTIFEPRLEKKLGVDGFRLPPVAPQVAPGQYSRNAGKLVGVRFPQWLQCPRCKILRPIRRWNEDPGDPALYCQTCSQTAGGRNRIHVVPVRFIVMCPNGHLDEFPWNWWVRHEEACSKRGDLKLVGSAKAGLAGLNLICLECGRRRSMAGCFGPEAIPGQCTGRRPWLGTDAAEQCSAAPRVVQRGASNIYFAVTESTLDIPPWSDVLQKKIGNRWHMLEQADDRGHRRLLLQAMKLPESVGMPEDELADAIEDRVSRLHAPDRNLRWEEYRQFTQHNKPFGENTEFEIRPAAAPPEIAPWIDLVVRATRLREVRAIRGFTRESPPSSGDDDRIAKLSRRRMSWLPAIENRGEGVFLRLDPDRLCTWEAQTLVQEHVRSLQHKYIQSWTERGRAGTPREITPRLLLVHSLAHALIRQLALSSGYGSSSLRERLYVGTEQWEMAALLIYTSSPDADGTLGGLARQGESRSVVAALEDCLTSMTWCSSDPLCIEGVHSLTDSANGAACHACLLASETSCEEFNAFLDRTMLVGTPERPELGYFHAYLGQR